jgi:hypothetical protein
MRIAFALFSCSSQFSKAVDFRFRLQPALPLQVLRPVKSSGLQTAAERSRLGWLPNATPWLRTFCPCLAVIHVADDTPHRCLQRVPTLW